MSYMHLFVRYVELFYRFVFFINTRTGERTIACMRKSASGRKERIVIGSIFFVV